MSNLNLNSIRIKLPVLFLLVALIPSLVSILWGARLQQAQLLEIVRHDAKQQVEVAHNIYQNLIDDLLIKTRLIAETPQLQNHLRGREKIALLNHLSTQYQELKLYESGGILEVYDASGKLLVAEPKIGAQHLSQEPVQAALSGQLKSYELLAEQDQLKLIQLVPIFHPDKPDPLGALALIVPLSNALAEQIESLTQTQIFFYQATDPPKLLATTLDEQSSLAIIHQANDPQGHLLAAKPRKTANGVYQLAVAVPTDNLQPLINSLQDILLVVEIGALLISLALALWLSRRFLGHIKKLVIAARQIEQRNFNVNISLDTRDEFGILAKTFDAMRQEIQETMRAKENIISHLTIRDQINQAIINRSGNALLQEVLLIISKALGAEKGSIMLLDHENQRLVLKVVFNPQTDRVPVHILEDVFFELGEGIAGQVAASGEAIISNDPQNDPRFKAYHFQKMDHTIQHLLCLPLKAGQEVMGVISLDNKPGGFDQQDQALVQQMANQVAIAIQNAELYELSITDGLTGLFIRRYFQDILDQELVRSQRFDFEIALIIFDIDHFKRFNDTYGHQVGDQVIQEVARLTQKNIRDSIDLAARIGGEEFAIIMPDTSLEGAYQVGERLRQEVEKSQIEYGHEILQITISLGCATFPAQATTRHSLIEKADLALYASKHRGRNQTTRFDSSLESASPLKQNDPKT